MCGSKKLISNLCWALGSGEAHRLDWGDLLMYTRSGDSVCQGQREQSEWTSGGFSVLERILN